MRPPVHTRRCVPPSCGTADCSDDDEPYAEVREKQARVILGSAEAAIAGKFVEAAMTYADHPAALQLRAMNIIYETTKERGATILMPTSMVDSMNPVVALALAG
jgi:hypothetical protein